MQQKSFYSELSNYANWVKVKYIIDSIIVRLMKKGLD